MMKHFLLTTIATGLLVGTASADPIHDAVKKGDLVAVQLKLDLGADVNAKDHRGRTSLIYAVGRGHKEIVELLITQGADVNAKSDDGYTALDVAIGKPAITDLLREHDGEYGTISSAISAGDVGGVKDFLAAGANLNVVNGKGWTLLHVAAAGGHLQAQPVMEIVRLLITHGMDVNAKDNLDKTPLDLAFQHTHPENSDILKKNGGKHGSIYSAAMYGDIDGVKEFLDAGVDVNRKKREGWAPLHIAAFHGHKQIVELLISNGAEVNALRGSSVTPLDFAVGENHTEIADFLRKNGGKTGDVLQAESSIHLAASLGNIEAVKQHLAAGEDVNNKDENGNTPLFFAASFGHMEAVEILIANGADVSAKTPNGWAPLYHAIETGSFGSVALLLDNGADVNDSSGSFKGSPLNWAAGIGEAEIVELLISKGANLMHKTESGATVLHSAVRHKDIVALLLGYGVNLNAVNNDGRTAIDVLCRVGGGPNNTQPSMETFEYLSNYLAITIQTDKQILLKAISVVPKIYEITRQVKVYDQHGFPMGITFETESIEIPLRNFTIEASDDLMIWEKIGETTNDPDDAGFIDKREKNSFKQFYRVVLSED